MDFRLRQHAGLGAEALDDAAHERPRRGEVTSTGASPSRAASSKRSRTSGDELGQPRRLHGKAPLVALADDRLGERLLPLRRQRDQRQVALRRGVLGADLAGEADPHVLGDGDRIAGEGQRVGDAFEDGAKSRIETRSVSRICSTRWMPDTVIWLRRRCP